MAAPRAVVVGAGLAGSAAAFRLCRAGFAVSVLEAAASVGGRAGSERVAGVTIDLGAPVLWSTDHHVRQLLKATGLGDLLHPLRPLDLRQLHRGELRPVDPRGPHGLARPPGLAALSALRSVRLGRLLARHRALLDSDRPETGADLDDRSVADFTRLYFGRSALDSWIGPHLADTTGCDPEETSRLLFLLEWSARCFATPGLPRRGGIARLCESLTGEVDLRTEQRVARLGGAGEGELRVEVEGDPSLAADAVVLATPADEAARIAGPLLSAPERSFLLGVRHAPAIVFAACARAPVLGRATRLRIPRSEGSPFEAITFEPGGSGERVPEGRELILGVTSQAFATRSLEESDEALAPKLSGELERIAPALAGRLEFTRLHRHPRARPRFDVGAFREIARFQRVQTDRRANARRLYFAGDYLVAPTVEGALASGARASDALIEDLSPRESTLDATG